MADKNTDTLLDEQKEEIKINSIADVSDDDTIQKAMTSNGFVLFFKRNLIKTKNHLTIIPLLLIIASLICITFTIPTFIQALNSLYHDSMNAFLFFCNVLLGILMILIYMIVNNKNTSKVKYWIFLGIFILMVAFSIFIDVRFINDAKIETTKLVNAINKISDEKGYIAKSISITYTHIILLGITTGLAFLIPFIQKPIKKLHIK